MAPKKKPSANQLAARAKFTAMVKAKAAKNKAAKKVAGLDKVVRKGKKTSVLYSRVSGVKKAQPAPAKKAVSANKSISGFAKRIGNLLDTSVIKDIDTLKKEYYKKAKIYHPDAGGTTQQFQQLQKEYESAFNMLLKGSPLTTEQKENEVKLDESMSKAVMALVGFDFINIELTGKWLWISGNTYPIRNELKEAGFMFASKKKMWFYKGSESKGKGNMDIEDIHKKYGTTKVMPDEYKKITGMPIPASTRSKLAIALKKAARCIDKRPI